MGETMHVAHRLFEKSKDPDSLEEIVQIIVKGSWRIWAVDVGVQFLCIRFYERGFLELGVHVEVAESEPIVERQGSEHEHYRERPKVELCVISGCKTGDYRNWAHRQGHRIRKDGIDQAGY